MSCSRRVGYIVVCVLLAVESSSGADETAGHRVCTFDSKGVPIAYLDQGQGEPVVLLHGFTGRLSDWPKMHNALLDAGYRVIAMDARGHGQSAKPHDVASYGREMADDVARFREPNGPGGRPLSENEIEQMDARFMEGQDQRALAAVIRAYPDLEVSEECLKNNGVPTFVVVGNDDPERPFADEFRTVMANARIQVIPDADHFTAGGRPEFLAAVTNFLKSHRCK